MLRLAFDFIITWRETRTRPNAYLKFIWSSLYPDLNLKNIPKKQVYFISCLSAFA